MAHGTPPARVLMLASPLPPPTHTQSAVRLAHTQLQTLQGEGHAPDAQTYLGLLRVAAGAADVPLAQSLITRMLDANVPPGVAHFHTLLRACVRGQRYGPPQRTEAHLRVALAAPPSMRQLGLPVSQMTLDLVLHAHTAARRIYRAVAVLDELYEAHGLEPSRAAFERALRMSAQLRRPQLAADLLERMRAHGLEPTAEQTELPAKLAEPLVLETHPKLPRRAWSKRRGFVEPTLSDETRRRWTVTHPPRLGGATPPTREPDDTLEEGAIGAQAVGARAAAYQLEQGHESPESRPPRARVVLKTLQARARKARARRNHVRGGGQGGGSILRPRLVDDDEEDLER